LIGHGGCKCPFGVSNIDAVVNLLDRFDVELGNISDSSITFVILYDVEKSILLLFVLVQQVTRVFVIDFDETQLVVYLYLFLCQQSVLFVQQILKCYETYAFYLLLGCFSGGGGSWVGVCIECVEVGLQTVGIATVTIILFGLIVRPKHGVGFAGPSDPISQDSAVVSL